jgi:hypothetical protein
MSDATTEKRFPVGGPRQPVYDFMRGLGFSMAPFGDKTWTSADKITVQIYGAGSMAHVHHDGRHIGNCDLDNLAEQIEAIRR